MEGRNDVRVPRSPPDPFSLKTLSGTKAVPPLRTELLASAADTAERCFALSCVAAFFPGKGFTGYPAPLKAIRISSYSAVVLCLGLRGGPFPTESYPHSILLRWPRSVLWFPLHLNLISGLGFDRTEGRRDGGRPTFFIDMVEKEKMGAGLCIFFSIVR